MKKHLVFLIPVLLFVVMSFAACGSDSAEENAAANQDEQKVAVGISWQEDINTEEHGEDLMAYVNTVEKAGGEPVLLDLVTDQESAKAELEKVDVLIMTGGEDVDPSYYGEEPDPNLEEVNKERDVSDMALLQEAIDEDMPVLCTCRGAQVLNVLSGGSLYQDIPTTEQFKDSGVLHRDPEEVDFTYHVITIEEDSLLADIVGTTSLEVNSWHHQGLKDIGDNLKVTATSEDGMVEGIERTDCSYVVGVQCHPEWAVEEGDDSFLVFFTDLIDHAGQAGAQAADEAGAEAVDGTVYGYDGDDAVEATCYQYMAEEVAKDYEPEEGTLSVPVVQIIAKEELDNGATKVYGDFWVNNYKVEGDTLECVSGGNHPGVMTVEETGGAYQVTDFEVVADGENFDPSAREIFDDNYDAFMKINSDSDQTEQIRAKILAVYVKANGLDVTQYQDYGWDPVQLEL